MNRSDRAFSEKGSNTVSLDQFRSGWKRQIKSMGGGTSSKKSFVDDVSPQSYDIMNLVKRLDTIEKILENMNQTASSEEGFSMYEQKEILEKIDKLKDELSAAKSSISAIDERTKRLEHIESSINEIKTSALRPSDIESITSNVIAKSDLATKDYVREKISSTKNWVYAVGAGTLLSIIGIVITLIRLFTM